MYVYILCIYINDNHLTHSNTCFCNAGQLTWGLYRLGKHSIAELHPQCHMKHQLTFSHQMDGPPITVYCSL